MSKAETKLIISDNLKRLMAKHKHSQGDVHKKTGISQSTVGRIINQEVSATIDSIDAISNLYGLLSWQLLVPGVDVDNPPALKIKSRTEQDFYEKMKALVKEMQ